MDGKNKLEEKPREVAGIRMYHIGWSFLQLGCDTLWRCWLTLTFLLILSTSVRTLSTCEWLVDDTVKGKDDLEEKARRVADIKIYHFVCKFFN